MPVGQHAPHFTVNEWKSVHTWTCSWTWNSSWCTLPFLHHVHQLQRTAPQEPLLDIIFFSFSFSLYLQGLRPRHALASPHPLPVGAGHSWHREKGATQGKGTTADSVSVALSCHISARHISGQCPPVLGWCFQRMMSAVGGLCLVSPAVSLPLYLRPFNCYPLPISIYHFPHTHFARSRRVFSSICLPFGNRMWVWGEDLLARHESVHKKKNEEEHQLLIYDKGRT